LKYEYVSTKKGMRQQERWISSLFKKYLGKRLLHDFSTEQQYLPFNP